MDNPTAEKPVRRSRAARLATWLWIISLAGVLAAGLGIFAVGTNLFGLFGGMPSLETLSNPKTELASVIYSADGQELGKYFRENRTPVTFEEISPNLIKALYATEDIRFEDHSGIDLKGIGAISIALASGKRRGSSTITQQLAKNLFSTRSELYDGPLMKVPGLRTVIIKAKEWIVAVNLERTYTKKEILTHYLNTVDFGSNAYGIKVAARTFYNTSPSDLKPEQAAQLVGLLKAPSMYSPIYQAKRSISRRNTVLDQMVKYNLLTQNQRDSLAKVPYDRSNYRVESHNVGMAAYFREELKKDLVKYCRENKLDLYSDGLRIYTTIDSRMQRYAEEAIAKHMDFLQGNFFKYWKGRAPWTDENGQELKGFIENAARGSNAYRAFLASYSGDADSAWRAMKRKVPMRVFSWHGERDTLMSPLDSIKYYKHYLHAGLLSIDPHTGYIRAWVGGINYKYFKYDHVRQGRRQPGSSFKPILYTAVIDKGYNPCVEMMDEPVSYRPPGSNSVWTPQNSDGKFSYKRMRLRLALAQSINSVAAQLITKVVSPDIVVEYAEKLGIESKLDPVPPLALGSSDVSLFELVGAYATFANKGTWTKPYYIQRITDKNGVTLKVFNPERREVLSEEVAYTMVHMLRGATTERGGTALGLHRWGNTLKGNEIAAKTGTTSNYSDGWFMGVTKDLVTGVWVGGDDRSIHFRSSEWGQGSRMAMPIWSYYMDKVYGDAGTGVKKGAFERPANYPKEYINCQAEAADTSRGESSAPVYKAPAKVEEDF